MTLKAVAPQQRRAVVVVAAAAAAAAAARASGSRAGERVGEGRERGRLGPPGSLREEAGAGKEGSRGPAWGGRQEGLRALCGPFSASERPRGALASCAVRTPGLPSGLGLGGSRKSETWTWRRAPSWGLRRERCECPGAGPCSGKAELEETLTCPGVTTSCSRERKGGSRSELEHRGRTRGGTQLAGPAPPGSFPFTKFAARSRDVPGGFSMFICWFLLTPWVSKLKYSDWIYKPQVLGREFGLQSWMWGHSNLASSLFSLTPALC
ncbi:uncharacterized protein LOC116568777 [Mustela erminea]|uniref:uncharacterized protein LOC116568777 n=1 Tax=Mustela erminea TaxID=36723 RepID=UPI001386AB35|nr:uncharacterized protein LOC116568777 [Mustela erminea]